jgi:hypothetical protein
MLAGLPHARGPRRLALTGWRAARLADAKAAAIPFGEVRGNPTPMAVSDQDLIECWFGRLTVPEINCAIRTHRKGTQTQRERSRRGPPSSMHSPNCRPCLQISSPSDPATSAHRWCKRCAVRSSLHREQTLCIRCVISSASFVRIASLNCSRSRIGTTKAPGPPITQSS